MIFHLTESAALLEPTEESQRDQYSDFILLSPSGVLSRCCIDQTQLADIDKDIFDSIYAAQRLHTGQGLE